MSKCRNWYNGDLILEDYHDHEWCKINHDDDLQIEIGIVNDHLADCEYR